jgi:hypothetical protein
VFDYYRATVDAAPELIVRTLEEALAEAGKPVTREQGPEVKHYAAHIALTDRRGAVLADVFWGGQNGTPNVELKGSNAALAAHAVRTLPHRPSRVDVKRDAQRAGLYDDLYALGSTWFEKYRIPLRDCGSNDPDKGNTFYLGARSSQVLLRIYQPGLKRAQEEGRTGSLITQEERDGVRVELEVKPQKKPAKLAAATKCPDALWGVSRPVAQFALEVFAMTVQPFSISDRRDSNRDRALRAMAMQYRRHLADLHAECGGDAEAFMTTLLDLADIPYGEHGQLAAA